MASTAHPPRTTLTGSPATLSVGLNHIRHQHSPAGLHSWVESHIRRLQAYGIETLYVDAPTVGYVVVRLVQGGYQVAQEVGQGDAPVEYASPSEAAWAVLDRRAKRWAECDRQDETEQNARLEHMSLGHAYVPTVLAGYCGECWPTLTRVEAR